MIHPRIEIIFPYQDESVKLFDWICNKINQPNKLEEFINLHIKVNEEVIKEITITEKIDLANKKDAINWSSNFLENYEEKIRKMRNASNLVFQRFHELNEEIQKIKTHDKHNDIDELMSLFLNRNGLLIGKIIFAYRETWFVANKIQQPDFKIGSVKEYKSWVKANLTNLKTLNNSLKTIQSNISKWKER